MEYQIPFILRSNGRSITDALSNSRVLRNEITAEVRPSFNAVKNAELKIAIPAKIKEME